MKAVESKVDESQLDKDLEQLGKDLINIHKDKLEEYGFGDDDVAHDASVVRFNMNFDEKGEGMKIASTLKEIIKLSESGEKDLKGNLDKILPNWKGIDFPTEKEDGTLSYVTVAFSPRRTSNDIDPILEFLCTHSPSKDIASEVTGAVTAYVDSHHGVDGE